MPEKNTNEADSERVQKRKKTPALFQKPRGPHSPETRRRIGARRRERQERMLKAVAKGMVKLRAIDMRFVVELVKNGGSPGAAAEAVGLSRHTGYNWQHRPEIAAAYKAHVDALGEELVDFREAAAKAKRTLEMLLDSPDEKVRMQAAKYLVDRHLGAVPQKIEAEMKHSRDVMTEVEMQAALSLVASKGLTLSAAKAYVKENPVEVTAWWQAQQQMDSSLPAMLQSGEAFIEHVTYDESRVSLTPGDTPRTHDVDPGRTNGGPEAGEGG